MEQKRKRGNPHPDGKIYTERITIMVTPEQKKEFTKKRAETSKELVVKVSESTFGRNFLKEHGAFDGKHD